MRPAPTNRCGQPDVQAANRRSSRDFGCWCIANTLSITGSWSNELGRSRRNSCGTTLPLVQVNLTRLPKQASCVAALVSRGHPDGREPSTTRSAAWPVSTTPITPSTSAKTATYIPSWRYCRLTSAATDRFPVSDHQTNARLVLGLLAGQR